VVRPQATTPTPVGTETVEQVVRAQLSKALGGKRGMLESAVPTLAFTVTWISTHQLKLALALGAVSALLLLAVRLVQRSSIQFVLNSLFGIGIAAVFALRSGNAEDAFLPGIIYNAVYGVVMTLTVLVRWPIVGFMVGSVAGDPTAWHKDPQIVRLCSNLTWMLIAPCVLRVAVQLPLYSAGEAGWLGVAKIALGWPLQVAALAGMVWLLARNHTPIDPAEPEPKLA
jgi:hypothetical protein